MNSGKVIAWNSDTGIGRSAAGILELNNGTAGTPPSGGAGLTVPNPASGAGINLTFTAASAAAGSGLAGGNIPLKTGAGDGAGAKGQVQVGTTTTADATAEQIIGCTAAARKGLVVQGAAGQTANVFEVQKSDQTKNFFDVTDSQVRFGGSGVNYAIWSLGANILGLGIAGASNVFQWGPNGNGDISGGSNTFTFAGWQFGDCTIQGPATPVNTNRASRNMSIGPGGSTGNGAAGATTLYFAPTGASGTQDNGVTAGFQVFGQGTNNTLPSIQTTSTGTFGWTTAGTLGTLVTGLSALAAGSIGIGNGTQGDVSGTLNWKNSVITDAGTIQVGTGTGTKIGTATTQKLGFWNATPVVQPASTGNSTTATAAGTNAANRETSYTGGVGATAYTVADIIANLKNAGLLAS
jgi:hypothetical protein